MKNMHKMLLSMVLAHGVASAVSLPSLPSKQDVKDFVTSPKKMGLTLAAIGTAVVSYQFNLYKPTTWKNGLKQLKSIDFPKFTSTAPQGTAGITVEVDGARVPLQDAITALYTRTATNATAIRDLGQRITVLEAPRS